MARKFRTLDLYPRWFGGAGYEYYDDPTPERDTYEMAVPIADVYQTRLQSVTVPAGMPSYVRIFLQRAEYGPSYIPRARRGDDMFVMHVATDISVLDSPEPERTDRIVQWLHHFIMELVRDHEFPTEPFEALLPLVRADLGLPGGDPTPPTPAEPADLEEPTEAFWAAIASLDGRLDEESVQALADRLRTAGADAVEEFATNLGLALAELDTEAHARQLITDSSSGVQGMSMGDDLFEFARLAVIAQGQAEWRRVLNNPDTLAEDRPVFDGEYLTLIIPLAHGTID